MKIIISKEDYNKHKDFWANMAKKRGWYQEPFFIHIWVNGKGEIQDSVSYKGISKDYVSDWATDKAIEDYEVK